MAIVTQPTRRITGGVDTHSEVHVAAVIDSSTHRMLATSSFGTNEAGLAELVRWMGSHGEIDAVGVESTGAYGAGLARHLASRGVVVVEVDRPDRKMRRTMGKSDPTDAEAAARAVLSGRAEGSAKSRDGIVEAIRVLEVVHDSATRGRTRAINQFKALLLSAPNELRERLRSLSPAAQLERARRLRDDHSDLVEAQTRLALKVLAQRVRDFDDEIARVERRLRPLAAQAAPALVGLKGVGPHVAAGLLAAAGDNHHRLDNEASFAKLCGVCPIPASSGKTVRHRLNRGGDRRANRALHTIVLVRMRHDPRTRAYVARRRGEGKTTKEIIRCLKRYVAREVFNAITNPPSDLPNIEELRPLRRQAGFSLTTVCNALGTVPIRLSELERGLVHDTDLARRAHDWIVANAI